MPSIPRRLPTNVQVLPPVFESTRGAVPEYLRMRSTLRGGKAAEVLAGRLTEEEYLRHIIEYLVRQGESLYKVMGSPRNPSAEARIIQAAHDARTGNQKPMNPLRLFMWLNKLSDAPTAKAAGLNPLKVLPLRSHTFSYKMVGQSPGQYSSSVFRPQADADVYERMILNSKTGPMEIVKTAAIPFVDIDTPTTGRFREVHPKLGITAGSKAEALGVLQRLADALKTTFRAYSSPGGVRAFDVTQEATPLEFYRKILASGDKGLIKKLDPHYVENTLRQSQIVPIGSAVRRWDPNTGKYYAFPQEYVYDFSGYPVRTSPKFNRNPLTDYIAAYIGKVSGAGAPKVNPEMLDTVLRMHDARAVANRARLATTAMRGDLADLVGQDIPRNLKEFIKKNYKLFVALGLLPAASATVATNEQPTA